MEDASSTDAMTNKANIPHEEKDNEDETYDGADDAASYDAEMSLPEREQRWGFTLSELQTATKVVRTLFHNPSLFIRDPYLADSRLYTMITRDRKTKRENRDVYKAIMNEEKSRRKRYQRLVYIETVRKTAMKREREAALNALMIADAPPAADRIDGAALPLRLRDRTSAIVATDAVSAGAETESAQVSSLSETDCAGDVSASNSASSRLYDNTVAARDESGLADDVGCGWASAQEDAPSCMNAQEKELLCLAGAFENIVRLEELHAVRRAKDVGRAAHAQDRTAASWSRQHNGDDAEPTRKRDCVDACDRPNGSHTVSGSAAAARAADARRDAAVTEDSDDDDTTFWLTVSQITAQVYRYLPHPFGSHMPPPLLVSHEHSDERAAIAAVTMTQMPSDSPYALAGFTTVGVKLWLAERLAKLVPLVPAAWSAEATVTTEHMSHLTKGEAGHMTLRHVLQYSVKDVFLGGVRACDARWMRSALLRIAVLRRCTSATASPATHSFPTTSEDYAAAEQLLSTALELCKHTQHDDECSCESDFYNCEGEGGGVCASLRSAPEVLSMLRRSLLSPSLASQPRGAAQLTLQLFIARRLYQSSLLRDHGESPFTLERHPPTIESEEPDSCCAFDEVQRYASAGPEEHHETQHSPHSPPSERETLKVGQWVSCHTCKVRYNRLHPYYYSMCHLCGEFNYNKRLLSRDLRGKVVMLTGCRIKIGYAMAISLLRCGAELIGLTRFIHEAVARFQLEPDYAVWRHRLHLFSVDLRDLWMVTQFCAFVQQRFPKIFALINNATQTIARTAEYTAHLRSIEVRPAPELRDSIAADPVSWEWHNFFLQHTSVTVGEPLRIEHRVHTEPFLIPYATSASSSSTSQAVTVCANDERRVGAVHDGAEEDSSLCNAQTVVGGDCTDESAQETMETMTTTQSAMPATACAPSKGAAGGGGDVVVGHARTIVFDRYDAQAEESDTREKNSWVLKLAEVQGGEVAEVMAINTIAPFIFNSKLKPCLMNRTGDASPNEARFIVNVSAMEGQFYRFKQVTHPHTNMAKAALNMMTRTSGDDYAADGIYMNSVDTGWITDESPMLKKHRRGEQFLLCPLDEIDAAARCLDLVYTNSTEHGKFFKDYKEIAW